MQNLDLPAKFSHLEVQMNALIQRSVHDDVPTDVHRQIMEMSKNLNLLRAELTPAPVKKKRFILF